MIPLLGHPDALRQGLYGGVQIVPFLQNQAHERLSDAICHMRSYSARVNPGSRILLAEEPDGLEETTTLPQDHRPARGSKAHQVPVLGRLKVRLLAERASPL